MLNIERRSHAYAYPIPRPTATSRVDLRSFARATFRYRALLLAIVGASIVAGVIFALFAKPVFIAEGVLLIDPHRAVQSTLSVRPGAQELLALDSAAVDSQVEMLKSDRLSRDVITKLDLTTNPDISSSGLVSTAFDALKALIRGQPATGVEIPAPIVREFQSRLDIKRVRETYMVSLRFKSGSPELAATIVNTLMQMHRDREGENRRNSIKAELDWMNDRLTQLRETISLADRALRQASLSGGSAQQDRSRLEREAESNRSVYQLLLDRYTSSLQQMSFPYAQATIVTGARTPQEKSFPNPSMILALSAIGGLLIGLGLIAYLEMSDDSFRSPQQVEATLGIPVVGLLPRPGNAYRVPSVTPKAQGTTSTGRQYAVNRSPRSSAPRAALDPLRFFAGIRNSSFLSRTRTLSVYDDTDDYRYAADKPMSRFAEGLRSVKAAFDNFTGHSASCRSIGFTSALAGEGASIVASNFAYLIAGARKRVLLIDAETRTGALTDTILAKHGRYLADVIAGRLTLTDATCQIADRLDFLGSSPRSPTSLPCHGADTAAMQSIIDQASMQYDYVVVNLPPTAPLADLRSYAPTIDALAVVVRWGATSQQTVRDALALPSVLQGKLIGVVLNDIDFGRLASEGLSLPAIVATHAGVPLFED